MRTRPTIAVTGPLVAVIALGALGAYTSLHHLASLGGRTEALIFVAVAALGALAGLAGTSRAEPSPPSALRQLASRAEHFAGAEVPEAVQRALQAPEEATSPRALKFEGAGTSAGPELAALSRSIEALGATAVALAENQGSLRANLAEAFVNLGRRNQNLVTRQLEYISELEQNEADPEVLDQLFRLDHLATRMRRNAESLLVLAGASPARQWDTPVPAMDIARAASAEVEDYKRLRLHHFDPALVSGSATTDLVHILAELVENALTYSPPGSPVDIYGRFLEGGYVIVIVDAGIGMSEEDLAVANGRLRGEAAQGEVPGRFLGHYVAGMLASRHGLAVSLQPSQAGGLVARVKIPPQLVQEPPAEVPGTAIAEPEVPAYSPGAAEAAWAGVGAPGSWAARPPGGPGQGGAAALGGPSPAPPRQSGDNLASQGGLDLGYLSPLASPQGAGHGRGANGAPLRALTRRPVANALSPEPGGAGAHPASQARSTADALRRLTRRVPGAALAEEDGSLRRSRGGAGLDSGVLPSALAQYLSAAAGEEHKNGNEQGHQ